MMNPILADYDDRKEALAEFERRKRARAIAVTVDDGEIKEQLRKFDQPICEWQQKKLNRNLIWFVSGLFGEGPADRRERLRNLLADLGEKAFQEVNKDESSALKEDSEAAERNRDVSTQLIQLIFSMPILIDSPF